MRCWCAGGAQRAYREVTQAGEYLRGGSFAELGSVFVVGEVADVVKCLDPPVVPDQVGEAFGSGLGGGEGGDAQCGDGGGEGPAQVVDVAFDQEHLLGVGGKIARIAARECRTPRRLRGSGTRLRHSSRRPQSAASTWKSSAVTAVRDSTARVAD